MNCNIKQNELNSGFIENNFIECTISDTHVNQFYLEPSYEYTLEQIRLNSECMENFLDQSNYDIESDSKYNSVFYEQTSQHASNSCSMNSCDSEQSLASSNETDLEKKSIMINCKNLYSHLVKPLKSKLVKKFSKNSKNQLNAIKETNEAQPSSNSTPKIHYINLKAVQNMQDIVYIPPNNSSPTNKFNNFGDFVLYNI